MQVISDVGNLAEYILGISKTILDTAMMIGEMIAARIEYLKIFHCSVKRIAENAITKNIVDRILERENKPIGILGFIMKTIISTSVRFQATRNASRILRKAMTAGFADEIIPIISYPVVYPF